MLKVAADIDRTIDTAHNCDMWFKLKFPQRYLYRSYKISHCIISLEFYGRSGVTR
jgi:hypothetical protein